MIDNINAEPDYRDEPPAACSSRVFLGHDSFACGGTPGHGGKHSYRLPWVTIEWDGRAERAAVASPDPDARMAHLALPDTSVPQAAPELAEQVKHLVVILRRISDQQEASGHPEGAYATGCAATMVEALIPPPGCGCTVCEATGSPHGMPQPAPELAVADWTVDPATGRTNASPAFRAAVQAVDWLLRGGAGGAVLHESWTSGTAALIVAQLAHVHHLTPPAPELTAKPGLRVDWARVSEAVADRERERDEARDQLAQMRYEHDQAIGVADNLRSQLRELAGGTVTIDGQTFPVATPPATPELADAIDPDKLDLLADWFDNDDAIRGRLGYPEVQADLRRWAKAVRDHRERAGLPS